MAASAYAVSLSLLFWMAPVIVGLLLAIPMAMLTSRIGKSRAAKLFGTPEQATPPPVLARANELANAPHQGVSCPIRELRDDPGLRDAHLGSLSAQKPRSRGQIDPHLAVARAKIEDAECFDEALEYLRPRETFAVLNSPAALAALFELPAAHHSGSP